VLSVFAKRKNQQQFWPWVDSAIRASRKHLCENWL
jgi:hypothetical protein